MTAESQQSEVVRGLSLKNESRNMKLRFRSFYGKEMTRLEVPDPCTLHQLQRILLVHLSMLPQLLPSSVRFSLNRKDELLASSPDDTLRSLGIASGDLLFYTLHSCNSDSPGIVASQNPNPPSSERIDSGNVSKGYEDSPYGNAASSDFSLESCSFDSQGSVSIVVSDDSASSVTAVNSIDRETRNQNSEVLHVQNNEYLGDSSLLAKYMDVDGNDDVEVCDKFSVPYFLRRVLRKELDGNKAEDDHRILVLAVHAVMLESGFVGVDPVTKMRMDRFYLPELWPSFAFSISLHYSFPEIPLGRGSSTESVVLGFQSLGQFMIVYGNLDKGKSDLRRVCLNESLVSPKIESLLLSCNRNAAKEVFEFSKVVKDDLALPLSIDLSERAGLNLPSCFMCLPVELKAKILKSLTGTDLAKVGCVCSELLFLSANNDLWKQKCIEEFGGAVLAVQGAASGSGTVAFNWKQGFRQFWKTKKIGSARHACPNSLFRGGPLFCAERDIPAFNRMQRELLRSIHTFGGDYGPLPLFGIPDPRDLFGSGVIPRCNLGGGGGRLF